MLASERRELIVKALHGAFPNREFCVADIQKRLKEIPDLLLALDTEFGHGFFKTKKNLHSVKIGRLLQQKLTGKRFGDLELVPLGKRQDVNYYRVQRGPRLDPVSKGVQAALEATARYERREEAPAVDKPTEAPTVQHQTGAPAAWRQPTRAELAARHHQTSGPSYNTSDWSQRGSITPQRGNFNL